jgi:hypothetical protein
LAEEESQGGYVNVNVEDFEDGVMDDYDWDRDWDHERTDNDITAKRSD